MDRGEEDVSTEGGALPGALNPRERPPPGAGSLILLPPAQAAAPHLSVPPPRHSGGQMIPTCCTSSPRGVTSPLLVRSHDRFGMHDKLPQSDALRGDLVIRDTASSFGICRCTAGLLPGA